MRLLQDVLLPLKKRQSRHAAARNRGKSREDAHEYDAAARHLLSLHKKTEVASTLLQDALLHSYLILSCERQQGDSMHKVYRNTARNLAALHTRTEKRKEGQQR